MQHKTVRYWTLRTRRCVVHRRQVARRLDDGVDDHAHDARASSGCVCIVRGEAPAATALGWGLRFWLITLPISAVWCGIATFVSSIFKTPILALLATFAVVLRASG